MSIDNEMIQEPYRSLVQKRIISVILFLNLEEGHISRYEKDLKRADNEDDEIFIRGQLSETQKKYEPLKEEYIKYGREFMGKQTASYGEIKDFILKYAAKEINLFLNDENNYTPQKIGQLDESGRFYLAFLEGCINFFKNRDFLIDEFGIYTKEKEFLKLFNPEQIAKFEELQNSYRNCRYTTINH